ncbi:MAG: hypothetical protein PHT62_11035 [Desulfotomaculaceae bacterium]|nr:hypothetical protein [Desulfotomaculaceae bacterium]
MILFKLQFSIAVMDGGRIINLVPLLGSFDNNGVIRFSEIRVNILAFIPLGIYICMLKAPWSFVKEILTIVPFLLVSHPMGDYQIGISDTIDYELITGIVRWRVKREAKGSDTL